jgi:hypothetical protein
LQGNLSQERADISVNASSLESRSQRRRLTFSRLIEPLRNLSQERADISITDIVHVVQWRMGTQKDQKINGFTFLLHTDVYNVDP